MLGETPPTCTISPEHATDPPLTLSVADDCAVVPVKAALSAAMEMDVPPVAPMLTTPPVTFSVATIETGCVATAYVPAALAMLRIPF